MSVSLRSLTRTPGERRNMVRLDRLSLGLAMIVAAGLSLGLAVVVAAGLSLGLAVVVAAGLSLGLAVVVAAGLSLRLAVVVAAGLSLGLAVVVARLCLRLSRVMHRSLRLCLMAMMMRTLSKSKRSRSQEGECCQYVFHCCFIGKGLIDISVLPTGESFEIKR